MCVLNLRSVSCFVWPGGVTQINTYTNIQVKLGISWTGCSPHVDFEKKFSDIVCVYLTSCLYRFFCLAGGGGVMPITEKGDCDVININI